MSLLIKIPIWLVCLFAVGWPLCSQTSDTSRVIVEDGWIEKMSNKVSFELSFNNSYNILKVHTAANDIILYPNTPNHLRLKLNYEFISLGIQFAPDFLPGNGDRDLKGDTRSLEIGTGLLFKHWFAELLYARIKGFYLKNTADYDIMWQEGQPYIQFPDLDYQSFVVRTGYLSNSRFSFKSLTTQTERQLKSVGSFMPVLSFNYLVVNDRSAQYNTQKSTNVETNIGPGYAYTFVVNEQFYMSLAGFTTFGYLNTKLLTRLPDGDVTTWQDNFIWRWDGRAGIGYNGDRFYAGLYTNVSGARYKQEHTTVHNFDTRVFYHLFLGMRFEAPNFLEKSFRRIRK
ncbi:DUF4421 family protein [Carboxylicivirga mesophila]|uniref:DUF4421 family protein n=1 Tax=Carboxylicivirga mesophila TaxID=1166478 RepID=A0ABS5KCL9_9BACT|nr:DUF4421 family protein [Carboxylicivirga mesophila]MBS2212780.1 DUF4421 family protein [Carboxylicivirga mesophila]